MPTKKANYRTDRNHDISPKKNLRLIKENIELKKEIAKLQTQHAKDKIMIFSIREEKKASEIEFLKQIKNIPPSSVEIRNQAWKAYQKRMKHIPPYKEGL